MCQHKAIKKEAGGILLMLILLIAAFGVGVYVGRYHFSSIANTVSETVDTPLKAIESVNKLSQAFFTKEKIISSINNCETLSDSEKKEYYNIVEKVFIAKTAGKLNSDLLLEWAAAEEIFKQAEKKGKVDQATLEIVMTKFQSIATKAEKQ
ncbi:MAG: hypothetical protein ABIH42_01420 [Planctomycetota bacterium]